MKKRYKETGLYSPFYLVECPKCKKEAIVSRNSDGTIIKCQNCMYKAETSDYILYEASIERRCHDCGKMNLIKQSNLKEAPKEIDFICPECGFKAQYKPYITSCMPPTNLKGMKGDPCFNFPLWLQTEVKGNLFWAYNREHLEEIRTYVESELRERQYPFGMTMVARLPQFIKDAKNRDDILKAIRLMQKK